MALSDRNIVITPNKGRTDDPKIEFSGANASVSAQTITLRVYPDNAGTLSFEGSAGQLFAITNDLTGTLFRVNDVSGIPSLEVNADGTVTLAEFSGNVGIGTGIPTDKLHVEGTVRAVQISAGNGTVSSPSFEFYNDPDTGIYLSDTNTLSFVTNGTIASSFTATGDLRLYNTAGTFYSQFSNQPTANRTLTVPDISGTVSLIQSAATAGYFDTSTTTPTGTTRLNYGGYFYPTFINLVGSSDTATAATHYFVETGSDGFVRPKTLANTRTEIVTTAAVNSAAATTVGTVTSGIWAAGSVTSSSTIQAAGTATVNALVSNGAITGTTGTFTSIQNSGLTRSANIVSNTWIHATQNLTVASSNASTATNNGALVITGGAGIGGNVNAGGVSHTFNGSIGIRSNTNSWGTGVSSVIQLKAPASSGSTVSLASIDVDNSLSLVRNAYFQDAVDWRYSSLSPATIYTQDVTGTHLWGTALGENAGNIVTFSYVMQVDSTGMSASNVGALNNMIAVGKLGVGTNSDVGLVNAASFFGTINTYGNIRLLDPTGGTAGIYFRDGTYQTTAFAGTTTTPSYGPAGTIQVAGAANAFTGDGSGFFWDNSNKRLGIGTASPTNILTVRSTATPAWFNTVNSAIGSNNYEILIGNSVVHGTSVGYVNNATVPYGYLSAGTTTRNIIIAANGRTGLGGTTVPQNILDVNGAAVIGNAYAGARTAPTNGLLVQGSVGIGTYTALQPLDVRGNAYITGTHNLFTNRVGIGTGSALGASANVLSIYGTTMSFGNIDIGNTAAGGSGIYFPDGTFQNTAYVPTTYTTFTYTGNGSTTTYSTSPITSSNINNTMVYVNGVYQRKETYGWSGTTITFDVAPPNFATIEIMVLQAVNAPFGSVVGDISVNGNITVSGGAVIASGSNTYVFNTVATGVYIGGNARDVQIGNAVSTTRFNSANASISTTTGAVVTPGGIGVGGNINVGGTRNTFTNRVGIGTSTALGLANTLAVFGTAMVHGNIDLRNSTGGTSGIFFGDGSYQTTAGGGGAGGTFTIKNANYTAVNGDKLLCDTSAGTFTITLPATPSLGTSVTIYDRANFTVFPLTIARNGSTIENLADDFSLDIGQTRNEIVYDGATWHIYVSIGPRGLPGANASVSSSVAYSIALG